MNILYMENYTPFSVTAIICICLGICVVYKILSLEESHKFKMFASIVAIVLCLITIIVPIACRDTVPRTRYYVTLEDGSADDILNDYQIEEQKGSLYIITERTN